MILFINNKFYCAILLKDNMERNCQIVYLRKQKYKIFNMNNTYCLNKNV